MSTTDKPKFTLTRRTKVIALLVSVLFATGGATALHFTGKTGESPEKTSASGPRGLGGARSAQAGGRAQPVKATQARVGDLDIMLSALGTVTASNTAIVKSRVDGQLVRIHFREGQQVKTGDLLAEIDSRQYKIQLDQVHGQLTKDEALLAAAKVDLERYRNLLGKDSIAKQQVDTQEALVQQYRGIVEADKAQVDNARLQLGFTRVTAPASGRLGLRQVDVGNNVRASDATGLVVITQTRPIHAVFAIPAESVSHVAGALSGDRPLEVGAWDRDGRTLLTRGKLLSLDNQIDVTTGTVKLKAEFANRDDSLFPNQFVNIRLKLETRSANLLLASAAIQRNAQGSFVHLIHPDDKTVEPRPVRLGPTNGELVVIEDGLQAGDQVVIDGADRLKPGGKVDVLSVDGKSTATKTAEPGESTTENRGQRRCSPEIIAKDPEAASRCERARQRREANGGSAREGARRAE